MPTLKTHDDHKAMKQGFRNRKVKITAKKDAKRSSEYQSILTGFENGELS